MNSTIKSGNIVACASDEPVDSQYPQIVRIRFPHDISVAKFQWLAMCAAFIEKADEPKEG